ncbi:hypothetical protein ACWEKM_06160 [Streptomyces sp. NPDC004752]
MTAEQNPYDGTDALLAAITGEAGPEATGPDPTDLRAAAEYRAAQADVALLREQLKVIGDALAAPAPGAPAPAARPAPRRAPRPARPRRRFPALAFGALAVACVVTVLSGLGWLLAQPGTGGVSVGADDSAAKAESRADSRPAYPAVCARLVVEGDVVGVEAVPGTGSERVTLRVTRYYRPERGAAEVTVVTDEAVAARPRPGEHVLLTVPRGAGSPDLWVTDAREIAERRGTVERELALSPAPECP